MLDVVQQNLFDYASLDADTRVFVQEKAQAIHARLKRTAEDIIAIGQDLIEVKARLGHGLFMGWIEIEFEMSQWIANKFIQVAKRKDKFVNLTNISVSVLYELASPSIPDTVIEMVETQQIPPTIPAIREAKQEAQRETFPPGLGLVNGKPFDMPLPDGKPVEIPEEWKLPTSVRTPNTYEGANTMVPPVEMDRMRHDEDPLPVVNRGVPAALQSSESNEWYTPAEYVNAARELMGSIDVDPASCERANKVIQAKKYYTKKDNGLMQSWANRVWLNPPYGFDSGTSNQEIWSHQLIERYKAGLVTEAVLLVNANTEAKWFHPLYEFLICFTNHRIRFYNTSGESSQPTQGNALVYFGKQDARFIEIFSRFGVVVRRADGR